MRREVEKAKTVATTEDKTVVSVPDIVGMTVVAVEPQLIVIVLHVEDVEVAVAVGCVRDAVRATAPRILSELYRIRELYSHSTSHQVSSAFYSDIRHSVPNRGRERSQRMDTGFGSGKP